MSLGEHPFVESDSKTLTHEELYFELLETRQGFVTMLEYPPGGSRGYQAMAHAVLERIDNPDEHPAFHMIMRGFMQDRQSLRGDHKAHLLRNALQFILLKDPNAHYPVGSNETAQWHQWMDKIQGSDLQLAELEEILADRFNQASDPNRYAGPKIGIAAHASKHPKSFDLLDVGCSAGFGNIQLGKNLDFHHIDFNASSGAQLLLQNALRKQLSLRQNVGMDRQYRTDWTWVESNSVYDYEVFDMHRITRRERLHSAMQTSRSIDIITGDITLGESAEGIAEAKSLTPDGKFDAVTGITSFYEIDADKLQAALLTFQGLGRVSAQLQDAIVQHSNGGIEIVDEIYKVPYGLYYMDLTQPQPDRRYVKLGEWDSFRCRAFTPTEYLVEALYEQSKIDAPQATPEPPKVMSPHSTML